MFSWQRIVSKLRFTNKRTNQQKKADQVTRNNELLKISRDDVINRYRTTEKYHSAKKTVCSTCQGSGTIMASYNGYNRGCMSSMEEPCPHCNGG